MVSAMARCATSGPTRPGSVSPGRRRPPRRWSSTTSVTGTAGRRSSRTGPAPPGPPRPGATTNRRNRARPPSLGRDHDPANLRPHPIEVVGGVDREQLQFAWAYRPDLVAGSTVERLAADFGDALRRIAADLDDGAAPR